MMKYILLFIISSVCLLAEIAKVSAVVGDAKILRDSQSIVVKIGSLIEEKDIIETKKNSKVQIIFKDNTVVTLGKSSALNINEYLFDLKNPKKSKTDLNFFKGAFKTITGQIGKINREKFKLRTRSSTIGIRGTTILGNQSMILCLNGEISVAGANTEVIVPQSNGTQIGRDGKPTQPSTYTQKTLQSLSNSLEPENTSSNDEATTNNANSSNTDSSNGGESSSNDNGQSDSDSNSSSESEISQEDSSIAPTESSSNSNDNSSNSISSDSSSSENTITQAAQEAIDDENKKEVEPQITTLTLSGNALGGYVESGSSATTDSFSQSDSEFNASRVGNKISFDETLKRKYSGSSSETDIQVTKEKTFTLGTPSTGGYTGHSEIGTINFSYSTINSGTLTGNYKVQADNMGEVFVLYHDGVQTDNAYGYFEFNELITFGKKADLSTIDKTKIYVYKDFASMRVEKDSTSNFTQTKLDTQETGYEYYNPYLDSMTHLNSDYYKNGAEEFIAGTNGKIKVHRNKYNFSYNSSAGTTRTLNMHSYNYGTTNADINVMGTDHQALSYHLSTTSNTKNYNSDTTTISSSENNGASFLDKSLMTTAKTTGTLNLKGYIVAEGFQNANNSVSFRKNSDNLELSIDRSNGNISGSSSIDNSIDPTDNVMNLNFSGEIANNTSYYINDDIFGVMLAKGDSSYKIGTQEYDLEDNSGYLIAVPDGQLDNGSFKLFDSNDNPLMSDDDSSWGYWTAKFDTSSVSNSNAFISPYSTWVAGIETPATVIDGLIANQTSSTYTFEGGVIGTVLNSSGNVESIITDGTKTNLVRMNFDIGGGNKSLSGGTIGFSSNSTTWDMQLSSSDLETTGALIKQNGFTSDLSGGISGTSASTGSTAIGSIKGKFYGQDSLKSVGGTFNVSEQSASGTVTGVAAQGVFKAIKK